MVFPSMGQIQQGEASFYKDIFEGRKTASGELFQQALPTAAHRTLALGTILKITNISNGKSAKVIINDRGPFIRNRILDVSKSVAQRLGFIQNGTAIVDIVILEFVDKQKVFSEHEMYEVVGEEFTTNELANVDESSKISTTLNTEIEELNDENALESKSDAVEASLKNIPPKKEIEGIAKIEETRVELDEDVV
jgi:rare lipoprotein A